MYSEPDDLARAIEALSEIYPRTFFVNGRLRQPLKHDIVQDIKADIADDPNSELRFYNIDETVAWYCTHVGYHKACSFAGTPRLDLNGNRAGTVTEAEARAEGQKAAAGFEIIEARKRIGNNREPSVSTAPAVVNISVLKSLRVNTNMTDDELLASIAKHVTSLQALLGGELVDQSLRKELSRPVLLLLIDELKTLDARLTA
jgi:sRNA-binding protein